MSEIYFIRHGQASFGSSDYDILSPVGIRQAQIAADHLAGLDIAFDAMYSGRMKRQQDTARPLVQNYQGLLSEGCPLTLLPAFDEYDARALLMARASLSRTSDAVSADALTWLRRDRKAFQLYFSQTVNEWLEGYYDGREGIETWPSFCERVRGGVEYLITHHGRGCRMAVFTSGGPISVVMQMALGLNHRKTLEISWEIMNASLTCIKYNGSQESLSMFNNTTPLFLAGDPT